jgi:hypothetical protein
MPAAASAPTNTNSLFTRSGVVFQVGQRHSAAEPLLNMKGVLMFQCMRLRSHV